ncbi:MAG: hypothetical protein JNN08_30670 [Bryobacterales bacterium]|nr:hypothetical protein [Bryobacterales bacterium]
MKQIIMVTDGKPSALTLEDGRANRVGRESGRPVTMALWRKSRLRAT